jgi:hypothetical protein
MLGYGIDNSAQEEYLETSGFKLYPHTYSIGASSISSMSRTLNASTEYYGDTRKGVSGDGIVQNLLKSFGYETYILHNSNYFFQGIGSSYDHSFPETPSSAEASSSQELVTKSIFMGEFRFDVEFGQPPEGEFLQHRLSVFGSVANKPRFVYMHAPKPAHADTLAGCRPNETAIFEEKLVEANSEMKEDLETIIQNDPGAVIVVAGDHGPYLTKQCSWTSMVGYDISEISRLDIQDRFGCLLAIRWPTEDFSQYDDITVLQDVFPAVFAYLFQDDQLLEASVDPMTLDNASISGAWVENGTIHGGINDGEPLFVGQ